MIIRNAIENDLPAIIDIYNESILEGYSTADLKPISLHERTNWFKSFDSNKRPIWVAEINGNVVACIYLSSFYGGPYAYDKTAEISTYILKSHQGIGLGTTLKQKMIDACPRLGVDNLISMYFDNNIETQLVNDKFGFKKAGHLTKIAVVNGNSIGLNISILRIST